MEEITSKDVFFALVKSGLWGKDCHLSHTDHINYKEIYQLADKQSVIGLLAEGLGNLSDIIVPKDYLLTIIGLSLEQEQINIAMNKFIAELVKKMQDMDLFPLLVKGQGIAQCYEKPLWRTSGDIDLLFSSESYTRAKLFSLTLSPANITENRYSKHLGLRIEPWVLEIHGSLRTGLSIRLDKVIDKVQAEVFNRRDIRPWNNENTIIYLPSPNTDIFFVFSHFVKHFYKGGMTIRQVCDWCRLLWTFKNQIDIKLLENRLLDSGLKSEWQAFAAMAVDYLGMPVDAMPLYNMGRKWSEKSEKIVRTILKSNTSNKMKYTFSIMSVFPWKTIQYMPSIIMNVNWLKIKERIICQ